MVCTWVAFHENDEDDENDEDNSDSYKQGVECQVGGNHGTTDMTKTTRIQGANHEFPNNNGFRNTRFYSHFREHYGNSHERSPGSLLRLLQKGVRQKGVSSLFGIVRSFWHRDLLFWYRDSARCCSASRSSSSWDQPVRVFLGLAICKLVVKEDLDTDKKIKKSRYAKKTSRHQLKESPAEKGRAFTMQVPRSQPLLGAFHSFFFVAAF